MKRHLLTIAVCLLLGAVVNVAVAWGSAFLGDSDAEIDRTELRSPLPVGSDMSHRAATADEMAWLRSQGWKPRRRNTKCTRWDVAVRERRRIGFNQRTLVPRPIVLENCILRWPWNPKPYAVLVKAGWPLSCVRDQLLPRSTSFDGAYDHESGLLLPRVFRPAPKEPQYLPAGVIAVGFAINTIFYAAFVWLLICGPFVLRRFLRVRRGLCPKCAYPMGESAVCTECGIALPRRRWAAHQT